MAAQVVQTAVVYGMQAKFSSTAATSDGCSVAFLFAAVLVGVVLPAQALSGRRAVYRQLAQAQAAGTCVATPLEAKQATQQLAVDDRGSTSSGDTTQPRQRAGPPPPSRAGSAKAVHPDALGWASSRPASSFPAIHSDIRSSTDSGGFSGLSDVPACAADCPVPSRPAAQSTGTPRSPYDSPPATRTDPHAILFIANPAAVQSCTVGCQTDDELLVWLFTGGSTTSSAPADDMRDGDHVSGGVTGGMELRASASGDACSPTRHGGEFGLIGTAREGWVASAYIKDAGLGGGAVGDASGRSGGIGKYDSFTSVWSRSAAMHTAPYRPHTAFGSGGIGSGVGGGAGGLEGGAGPRGTWLEDANLSNGSQQAGSAPTGTGKVALPGAGASGGSAAGPSAGYAAVSRRRSSGANPGQPPALPGRLASEPGPSSSQPHSHLPASGSGVPSSPPAAAQRGRGNSRSGCAGASGVSSSSGISSGQLILPGLAGLLGTLADAAANPQSQRSRRGASRSSSQLPASLVWAAAKPETGDERGTSGTTTPAGASGMTAGSAGAGAAAVASRSLARRQRLQQRSRTFSELSPQRSLALVELAVSGAGAPLVLPPAHADKLLPLSGGGGVNGTGPRVEVPSPYSEDSAEEDESVRRLRTLRSMRRHHPELAASLDRFATVLLRQAAAAGAGTATAAAGVGLRPLAPHGSGRLLQEPRRAPDGSAALETSAAPAHAEGQPTKAAAGVSDVRRRRGRPVRRTQSYSSLEAMAQQRDHKSHAGGAAAASPLLRTVLENGSMHGSGSMAAAEELRQAPAERGTAVAALTRPPAAATRTPTGTPEMMQAVGSAYAVPGPAGPACSAPTTGPPSFEVMFLDAEAAAAEATSSGALAAAGGSAGAGGGNGLDSSGSRRWSITSGGSAITITGALNSGRVASCRSSTDVLRAETHGPGSAKRSGTEGVNATSSSAALAFGGIRSGPGGSGEGSAIGFVVAARGSSGSGRVAAVGPALELALGSSDAACAAHMDPAQYRQRCAAAARGGAGMSGRQSEASGGASELALTWQAIMGARRCNGSVQRSRSAGEARFRPAGVGRRSGAGSAGDDGSGRGEAEERQQQQQQQRHQVLQHHHHWHCSRQQLPHQEHRRAALVQAWQAVLAETGLPSGRHAAGSGRIAPHPLSASGELAACGVASRASTGSGFVRRDSGAGQHQEPSLAELAGLDAEALAPAGPTAPALLPSAPGGSRGEVGTGSTLSLSGDGGDPDSATPSGSDSPAAAELRGSGAAAGAAAYKAVHGARATPATRTNAGGAHAAARTAAGSSHDDRSARLSKSLSERSLARVVTTTTGSTSHYRRVSRTKSRFALLQQAEPGEGGADALSRHPVHRLVRNSSGGSLGSRQLADVKEEDDELMAAEEAAALAAAATARASADGRRPSADDLSAVVELARRSRSSNAGRDSTSTNSGINSAGGAGAGGGRASSSGSGGMLKLGNLSSPGCLECEQLQPVPEQLESAGGSGRFGTGPRLSARGAGRSGRVSGADNGLDAAALAGAVHDGEDHCAGSPVVGVSAAGTRRRSAWRSASELSLAGLRFSGGPGPRVSTASRDAEDLALELSRMSAESAASAAARAALLAAGGSAGGVVSSGALVVRGQSTGSNGSVGSQKRRAAQARACRSSQSGRRPVVAVAAAASESGRPRLGDDSMSGRDPATNPDSLVPNGSVRVASVSAGVGGGIEGDDGNVDPRRAAAAAAAADAAAGELGMLESSDSDQELLEVLAAETRAKNARDAAASPLARIRQYAGVPGKVASFRFAAPIVPPAGGSANSTSAGGAVSNANNAGAGSAPPFQTAGAGGHAGEAAATGAADDIPIPPLAAPVVPERELVAAEHQRQHQHHSHRDLHTHSGGGSTTSNAAAAAASTAAPSASQLGATGTAPAPLSAVNLHEHTRRWDAAAPASNPAAIVAQLTSPSPSQSGPIDPLSEPEGAGMSGCALASAAALLQSALESTAGVANAHAGGGEAGRGGIGAGAVGAGDASHAGAGNNAAGGAAAQGSPPHGRNSQTPIPKALVVARLSMPLAPYGNSNTTALVAAAVAGGGSGALARGLSRQASATTVGGVSVSASSDGHQSQGPDLGLAYLPPSTCYSQTGMGAGTGDDSNASRSIEQPPTNATYISNLSRTPSHMAHSVTTIFGGTQVGGGGGPARSIIACVNSGGGGGMYGGGGGRGGLPSMVRGQSKLGGGAGGGGMSGGDTVEAEVEEAVLANRRLQDERAVLMDEINIDKILGFGSMGMVYHGRLYDTKVVIKLIEHGTGVLGKEKERGRLARVEACVSRMLLHPNIVLTYDACTGRLQPGRLAAKLGRGGGGMGGSSRGGGGRQRFMTVMVQEFCELGTLRDAINRRKHGLAGSGPESAALLYRVALDIANGMKHLAALRVIHADLKAENVLLQRADVTPDRPHGFVAKVADFGLAMVLPPGEDGLKQGIHGTVSHMPPEAMRDTVFSLATDVFSFGVVLWELYTGESPYRGMAPHEVVEAVCARGERPAWPDGVLPELSALAEDCWHTDPDYRPTFGEVVERLRGLLAPARGAPERCPSMLSGMTEESDELEAALRQQRRGAPAPSVRGPTSGGMAGIGGPSGVLTSRGTPSEAGSDMGFQAGGDTGASGQRGGAAASGIPTADSGNARGSGFDGADAGVPREAPRDPLGLLLWALCQFPAEEPVCLEDANGPDTVQWVMQVENMVLRSREEAGPSRSLHSMSASMAGAPPSVVIEEHP